MKELEGHTWKMDKRVVVQNLDSNRTRATFSEKEKSQKVAFYCYIRADEDLREVSKMLLENEYKQKIISVHGWHYAGIYMDFESEHLPGFQKLMNDAIEGKVDRIIIRSLSQFTRTGVRRLSELLRHFPPISFYFEQENLETTTPESVLMLYSLAAASS